MVSWAPLHCSPSDCASWGKSWKMLTGKSCLSRTWGWLIKSHPNPQLGDTALHTNTASYNKALLTGTLWGGNGNMEIRPYTTSQWLTASSCGVSIFHSPLLHFLNMHYHYSPHTGCGLNPLLLKLVNLTHLTKGEYFLPDASCTRRSSHTTEWMQAHPSIHHYTVNCSWNLILGCKFLNFFVAAHTEHTLLAHVSNLTAPGFALVLGGNWHLSSQEGFNRWKTD